MGTASTTTDQPPGRASSQRLLESSEMLSYDPNEEIDWEAPLPEHHYGLTPKWSTLYGTPLWDELTEFQRVTLTRHEVGSILASGIWFEMILQQIILRDQYVRNPANAEFQFALTEIADECRHSLMFARSIQRLEVPAYFPPRWLTEIARPFKSTVGGVVAYGATLVAEEVLDVLQRDMMRDERVLDLMRTSCKIHVTEESRHMKFARDEIHEHLQQLGPVRRFLSGIGIAAVSYFIVSTMISPRVYDSVGLDRQRAVAAAKANESHKSVIRNACGGDAVHVPSRPAQQSRDPNLPARQHDLTPTTQGYRGTGPRNPDAACPPTHFTSTSRLQDRADPDQPAPPRPAYGACSKLSDG